MPAVLLFLLILYNVFQVLSDYYTQNLSLGCFGLNNLGFCQQPRLILQSALFVLLFIVFCVICAFIPFLCILLIIVVISFFMFISFMANCYTYAYAFPVGSACNLAPGQTYQTY